MRTLVIIILILLVMGLYYRTAETKELLGFVIKNAPDVSVEIDPKNDTMDDIFDEGKEIIEDELNDTSPPE